MERAIKIKIMDIIADTAGLSEVNENMDLMDDIGLSSIGLMDLLGRMELEFQIKISARELRRVLTCADFICLIEDKMSI